jgi:trehalose 6-phosphate phosphatase
MRYLLSRATRSIVTRLARERTLCAFDFDGTLAPIVDRPEKAGMRARTWKLLGGLATLYPCIVVSGRARSDVLGKLRGIKLAGVIGNHGAEMEGTGGKSRRRVRQWKEALKADLPALPGVWVEDKGLSLTVHYRQSENKANVRRHIVSMAGHLKDVRVFGGKQVVNLVMDNAPHKGDALAAERDRLGCSGVLYVGDDDNDEDAFGLDGRLVPVRIGHKRHSHAHYYLRNQREIDELLDLLRRVRSKGN